MPYLNEGLDGLAELQFENVGNFKKGQARQRLATWATMMIALMMIGVTGLTPTLGVMVNAVTSVVGVIDVSSSLAGVIGLALAAIVSLLLGRRIGYLCGSYDFYKHPGRYVVGMLLGILLSTSLVNGFGYFSLMSMSMVAMTSISTSMAAGLTLTGMMMVGMYIGAEVTETIDFLQSTYQRIAKGRKVDMPSMMKIGFILAAPQAAFGLSAMVGLPLIAAGIMTFLAAKYAAALAEVILSVVGVRKINVSEEKLKDYCGTVSYLSPDAALKAKHRAYHRPTRLSSPRPKSQTPSISPHKKPTHGRVTEVGQFSTPPPALKSSLATPGKAKGRKKVGFT